MNIACLSLYLLRYIFHILEQSRVSGTDTRPFKLYSLVTMEKARLQFFVYTKPMLVVCVVVVRILLKPFLFSSFSLFSFISFCFAIIDMLKYSHMSNN